MFLSLLGVNFQDLTSKPAKGKPLDCNTAGFRTLLRGSSVVGVLPCSKAQDCLCHVCLNFEACDGDQQTAWERLFQHAVDRRSSCVGFSGSLVGHRKAYVQKYGWQNNPHKQKLTRSDGIDQSIFQWLCCQAWSMPVI